MENKPTYFLYHITEREQDGTDEKRAFWTKIGAAWSHKDGNGFALETVYGRLVLRKPQESEEKAVAEEQEAVPATV